MRISYIASNRIPSARANGYGTMKLCEEWGRLGHTVRLIVPNKKHSPKEDAFTFYSIKPLFKIIRPSVSDFLAGGETLVHLRYLIDTLSYMYSLLRIGFSHDDIIYTREYLLALVLPKSKLFLEMHTLPNSGFLVRRALRRARGIIAISSGVRDAIVRLGISPQKILVAHDGVDPEVFAKSAPDRTVWKKFGIDPNKKIVLYTGHFYGWKGTDTLVEAAQYVPRNVHIVLMGAADEELVQYGQHENISIVPHQPFERVPQFLKSADVLVLPNSAKAEISRSHASPLKLFEYMAAGVPIVASDVPSIREILDDASAFWFTPDDAESCAQAIAYALSHTEEAGEKISRARAIVEAYSWKARGERIVSRISHTLYGNK
ncbi:MAG: glycosyltransferase family 4 protein [bacterium]|nr:glycosyltransferase family 4 protein [bacterium]